MSRPPPKRNFIVTKNTNELTNAMPDQSLSKESLQRLQQILEAENGYAYDITTVEEIGRGLINIYSQLADNSLGIGRQTEGVNSTMKGSHNEQEEPTNGYRSRLTIKGFAYITRRGGILPARPTEAIG